MRHLFFLVLIAKSILSRLGSAQVHGWGGSPIVLRHRLEKHNLGEQRFVQVKADLSRKAVQAWRGHSTRQGNLPYLSCAEGFASGMNPHRC